MTNKEPATAMAGSLIWGIPVLGPRLQVVKPQPRGLVYFRVRPNRCQALAIAA
jgi:hypothetical protein